MPKIIEVYNKAISEGKPHGVLSADIRTLIASDMGYDSPIDTLYHKDEEMTAISLFNEQFARLLKGEPVEYILGEASFLQYKVKVDSRVLIPRMETQELVAQISERILDYYDPRNFLMCADIGTGSGVIALALKSIFKNWIVSASDISEGALEVANGNFERYGLRIPTFLGPSLKPYIDADMKLDVIVSNPPYITSKEETQDSVKDSEPGAALWLDKEHSVYEDIFRDYEKVKKGSLLMCFEIGYDLEDYLTGLMAKYLKDYEFKFVPDLNGKTRFLFIYIN